MRQVWKGLPDFHVELDQVLAGPRDRDQAALGAPATKCLFQASFFDYVRG